MSIKSSTAILACKISSFILKKGFKKGTSLPGKIAKKICPDIMAYVSKNTRIILITGTNGKTTSTSMIYNMVKAANIPCFSNVSGANMEWGIITSFIDHYHYFSSRQQIAVIEIDEANVPLICRFVKPEVICITNLFRDQLDRYGEVYTTLEKIMKGVRYHQDTTLILNGDEPLLGGLEVLNPKIFYGFNTTNNQEENVETNTDAKHCIFCHHPYEYSFVTYNHLGKYHCPHCGYERPQLNDSVNEIIEMLPYGSTVKINDEQYQISQSGLYNIYNALTAYSIASYLKLPKTVISNVLATQESRFGRQEMIDIEGHQVTIFLVKNPAGFNQTIDTIALDKEPFSCLFMLNDNYADGTDVSWIYDVHLEKLAALSIEEYYISGKRAYDMAVRLKVATNHTDQLHVFDDYDTLTKAIIKSPSTRIYATLTYTAMLDYRRYLQSKGYIKNYWR
ncbi:MAG: MurT ligase domain-containing protein [Beduini sp.]